ncbi:integrase catalytic domain-containing protein [Trichonephila inaurata madagascariensis]|uniref:Integrase catalytic domain-containing protein n=1 Tax=Trichonephila inaurata madagascariensis TaxID=2747483 RepID=A0A8X6YKS3_9ARAC|nr:integrase catalytic domain-containing protein [Trichonephila inaurata madagascariensis]
MGDLPRDRIVPSKPFEKVGLDYAGPIITKLNLKRSRVATHSIRNKFWNRWSTEYLTHLQTHVKWSVPNPNLRGNQLILLKDPNIKPLDWPIRHILQVFPGNEGLVTVVYVKTSSGILKRAITKVVLLPIPDDPAAVEQNI